MCQTGAAISLQNWWLFGGHRADCTSGFKDAVYYYTSNIFNAQQGYILSRAIQAEIICADTTRFFLSYLFIYFIEYILEYRMLWQLEALTKFKGHIYYLYLLTMTALELELLPHHKTSSCWIHQKSGKLLNHVLLAPTFPEHSRS